LEEGIEGVNVYWVGSGNGMLDGETRLDESAAVRSGAA